MRTHQDIDRRSLALAKAVAEKVDADLHLLAGAHAVCRHWLSREELPAVREWMRILERPWDEVKRVLLEDTENGRRLRQNSPFCGILTPRERWQVYERFRRNEKRES